MTHIIEENDEERRLSKNSSKIFRRNRAMGYVSNQIPAVIRYVQRRKDTLITTCIGRSFQVYTASHFRLLHVSGLHPDDITALANDRHYIYTASDKCIYVWRAGKHIAHVLRGHKRDIHLLLPFGSHLIAVDHSNVLRVWDVKKGEVYLEVPFNKDEFQITALSHPPTYLNKIILGSQEGLLKLWNIKDNRLIYTFSCHESQVTCIEPSPALDVVAVGHQNGAVVLLNLKYDEVLMEFKQDWGPVSKIAFRTDGPPIMATTCTNGYIAFWDLEERKIATQLQAHDDNVTTAICFTNEPLLLSTSPDNSMKLWIFDLPDGGARLLRIREGHTAPPTCIRYHGNTGVSLLSSGEDGTLRVFSTISESLNKSMGKASYKRKASKKKNRFEYDPHLMPPIIEFTSETTRDKEWDSIAAIHSGIIQTTTWSFDKNRMGEHRLIPEKYYNKNRKDFKTETTCLTLTHCGNFVIIGYSSGELERFNIQSGLHRASYGSPAHQAAVRGVATDNLNQFVISGCSEGLIKFWAFKVGGTPMGLLRLNDGVTLMRSHRESAMVAVALVTFVVYIIDTDTKVIIRKFVGHTAKINDLTFSPDSRWLITAAMDSTIKVWDIPSSYMIDHFCVERPCTSLSMSPTGDFLATAHINLLGIYLWSNKTLFNQITLRSINPYEPAPYVGLPSNISDAIGLDEAMQEMSMDIDDDGSDEEEKGELIDAKYETPAQLSDQLISLSGLAASRWQNLLDLEMIKKHHKPKAPPKVPKQAPFFLPTVSGLELKFDLNTNGDTNPEHSRVQAATTLTNLTNFGKLLDETVKTKDYTAAIDNLKKFGPSMVDFEIKSLHPIGGGTTRIMVQFLKMIEHMFTTNLDFELAQSYLSCFLRSHGLSLVDTPDVIEALKSVSQKQEESWQRLEEKFTYGIGVVSALRNFVR